ncbi:hypothetical protein H310_09385 [Aphanomyces invadans]|uniref:Uncharacterized protein n=1 Tax=Aphanomyces invadans TaxID=157072 RepID=A0A024TTI8_9STRA|nr:hypothetical protein H310_09385 [Aphanomyces invadans]ETV97455.1 hypothetical protein H310_09385 [Aphanomyces invadans]|eukprot:XP_008873664.1 hypothetical protein H310_09385 [Aphanomyces invadans]
MAATEVDELTTHVTTFLRILQSSQTQELHEWNAAAMHRAWDWAVFVAGAVRDLDQSHKARMNTSFRYNTVPMLSRKIAFDIVILEQAPNEFVRAIVCSPYLLTHPLRADIVQCVVGYYPKLSDYEHKQPTKGSSASSRLFADIATRLSLMQSAQGLMRIATILAQAHPTTSVVLGSRSLVIPSYEAWRSQPATLQIMALAHEFQRQALAREARNSSDGQVEAYIGQVEEFFNSSCATSSSWSVGKSLVVQATLLRWPDDAIVTQQRLLGVVHGSVAQKPTRLLELSPWLAGDLCRVRPSLAKEYLPCLVAYAGPANTTAEWPPVSIDERLGCLVAGSSSLTEFCEACLAHSGLHDTLASLA